MGSIIFKELVDYIEEKEKLNFTFKPYWVILWYGRSKWDEKRGTTIKETILLNVSNSTFYFLKEKQNSPPIKLYIEEYNTREIPLGAILNKHGNVIDLPTPNSLKKVNTGRYNIYNITINSTADYIENDPDKSILNYLINTNFPLYEDLELYKNCPYYKLEKINQESKISTTILIPIHVILQSIYYQSNSSTDILINKKSLLSYFNVNGDKLTISSREITEINSVTIGQFLFTTSDLGEKCLKMLHFSHRMDWINEKNKFNRYGYSFIRTKIPFDFNCLIGINGIYINSLTESNTKNKLILAFNIISIRPENKEDVFFKNFSIIDLDDRSTTDKRNEKDSKKYNLNVYKENESTLKTIDSQFDYSNKSTPLNFISSKLPSIFPKVTYEKIKRIDQQNKYEKNSLIYKEIHGISQNLHETSNESTSKQIESTYTDGKAINMKFLILEEMLKIIKSTQNFEIEYLFLEEKLHNKLTIPPIINKHVERFCIIQITTNYSSYILIDPFEYKKRIALFRRTDNEKFKVYNDLDLINFIRIVISNYNYNWSTICKEDIGSIYGIKLFKPMNHNNISLFNALYSKPKEQSELIQKIGMEYLQKIIDRIKEDI